jgi:peroxin-16
MAVQECLGRPPIAQSVSYDSLHEKDREALKEYLPSLNLRLLSSKELRNHLVDVRARELANLFGKHRHAHDRPPTPPGFWRTDMPSTQELERDRQMAKEMERVKVLERYREAMRPGGLWMFADE